MKIIFSRPTPLSLSSRRSDRSIKHLARSEIWHWRFEVTGEVARFGLTFRLGECKEIKHVLVYIPEVRRKCHGSAFVYRLRRQKRLFNETRRQQGNYNLSQYTGSTTIFLRNQNFWVKIFDSLYLHKTSSEKDYLVSNEHKWRNLKCNEIRNSISR